MKTCVHCRLDIPLSAQVCPGCLSEEPLKGAGSVWWILAAGVVLFWIFG